MSATPRELPGLYWDEAKRRYFPLSSKPAPPPLPPPPPQQPRKRRRTNGAWRTSELMRMSYSYSQRSAWRHDVVTASIHTPSRVTASDVADVGHNVTAFVGKMHDEDYVAYVGDSGGWLHQYTDSGTMKYSERDLALLPEISSVCQSGEQVIATSFGAGCTVAVRESPESTVMYRLAEKRCSDVRASHLLGPHLALGAAQRAVYLPNIASTRGMRLFNTGSDVLAVVQQPHLVYAGARSGAISRFDVREDGSKAGVLCGDAHKAARSSITHLSVIHEWALLVSTISGDLRTYDLRYSQRDTPLMQFDGHVNTYTARLGIAVDPVQDLLFAAGQDRRVRLWSLRSGELLNSSHSASSAQMKLPEDTRCLLEYVWPVPVPAMQVLEDAHGMNLWLASGREVQRYRLGRRLFW